MENGSYADGAKVVTDQIGDIPYTGLLISLATLVCFLLMCYDVWNGFRSGMPWLPCNRFALNSLSLTVLATATRLFVSVNTPMPRPIDQILKVSDNALLAIFMGVFMPSMAIRRKKHGFLPYEGALYILVITVVVKTCQQIFTGVIYTFIPEHAIVVVCILVFLLLLYKSTFQMDSISDSYTDLYEKIVNETRREWSLETMRGQLKRIYAFSYLYNPQFSYCETTLCLFVALFSILVVFVVAEAAIRGFLLRKIIFVKGISYFKFSAWLMAVIHVWGILVGVFVAYYRWHIVIMHTSLRLESFADVFVFDKKFDYFSVKFPFLIYVTRVWVCAGRLIMFFWLKMRILFGQAGTNTSTDDVEWVDLVDLAKGLDENAGFEWKGRIVLKKMKKSREKSRAKTPIHLIKLLPNTFPPQTTLLLGIIQRALSKRFPSGVSSLSLMILAKISDFSVSSLGHSLKQTMGLIFFVEEKMTATDHINDAKRRMARKLLVDMKGLNKKVHSRIIRPIYTRIQIPRGDAATREAQEEVNLNRALSIIREIGEFASSHAQKVEGTNLEHAAAEVRIICDSILDQNYKSTAQLAQELKQTYLAMVSAFLIDLPRAIFKEYHDSSIEVCKERVERSLKFFWKLEQLGEKFRWSWPNEEDTKRGNGITIVVDETELDPKDDSLVPLMEGVNTDFVPPNYTIQ